MSVDYIYTPIDQKVQTPNDVTILGNAIGVTDFGLVQGEEYFAMSVKYEASLTLTKTMQGSPSAAITATMDSRISATRDARCAKMSPQSVSARTVQ